jgi:type IV conjugative transfer system protein TraL
MERKFPQYLSKPYQILWFEPDDLAIMAILYLLAMIFGSVFWLLLPLGPFAYGKFKRQSPRGFLRHLLYCIGLTEMKGYPTYFEEEFHE